MTLPLLGHRLYRKVARVARMQPIERVRRWLFAPRPVESRELDLAAPECLRDPFAAYEILRRGGPVRYLPRQDFWIVLGHEEMRQVCSQPGVFSNSPYADIDAVLIGRDPPEHTAVRRLIAQQFSAAILERVTTRVAQCVAPLIKSQFDAVNDFAVPLAGILAAELAGFDEPTTVLIRAAQEASLKTQEPIRTFIESLDELADRAAVFSILLRDGKDFLDEAQVRSLVRFLWLAGTTTTQRAIAQNILCLLQSSGLHAQVRADPGLAGNLIEEVLRLHPPEHLIPRRTTCATDLGGVTIPSGALVQLCLAAANRDPREFTDAGTLRLDRDRNRHLSFGIGVHHCSGTALARRVIPMVITTLLRTAPHLHAAEPLDSVQYFSTHATFTPSRVMVAT